MKGKRVAETRTFFHGGVSPGNCRPIAMAARFVFGEANVRSLCSVGKSTKKKAEGYIGEKGIGFKSVFRVTDEPAVYSNGYRFRLPSYSQETK